MATKIGATNDELKKIFNMQATFSSNIKLELHDRPVKSAFRRLED